ncbi:MAG: hypothetical protein MJZ19_07265 [Paludibacteraceae bacterium]|nr:hypothetical protein [Paludibacteraceae bacterium]
MEDDVSECVFCGREEAWLGHDLPALSEWVVVRSRRWMFPHLSSMPGLCWSSTPSAKVVEGVCFHAFRYIL